MTWTIKDFNEHQNEWMDNPTMPKQEVLEYLDISEKQLKRLVELGWIDKVIYPHPNWKGHCRLVYLRADIIAFAHEVGLRT